MRCSNGYDGGADRADIYADCNGYVDEPCRYGGESLDKCNARGGIVQFYLVKQERRCEQLARSDSASIVIEQRIHIF